MGQRVNEDIRFYLPADPYYYQVDNLPLEDLLANDVRLQSQIDEINSTSTGTTVNRSGFTELQPFVDAALPGRISVRAGNFIGRVQRTSAGGGDGGLVGAAGLIRLENGTWEINTPPNTFGSGENPTGNYAVSNPPNPTAPPPGKFVGRNAVFNFPGGNISIDAFNFSDFDLWDATSPPLGRLDLIGITTMNGAMDDPYLPGNTPATNVNTGDGTPKLAVVKGAGITTQNNGVRQVVIGEKYITVGLPQEYINDYGRDLEGNVVPNPQFGTTPMPDDVVNVNFARDLVENGEISQTLSDFAYSNKNGNFFLPIAYVFVPQRHVEGNPIPAAYLKDIRPFFRTAELTLQERQAVATSLQPSYSNPFTTKEHADSMINRTADPLEQRIADLEALLNGTLHYTDVAMNDDKRITNLNNVRGKFGWRKITLENMSLSPSLAGQISHVKVFFWGFKNYPDRDGTYTYAYAGPEYGGNKAGKVLVGKSAGDGDNVSFSNTSWVEVNAAGEWYAQVDTGTGGTGAGFNLGFYAEVQGWRLAEPIRGD